MKHFWKGLTAAVLSAAMIVSLSGCSLFGGRSKVEDIDFDTFCEQLFTDIIESDSLTAHFTVTDETRYGITFTEEDYSFGTISMDDYEGFEEEMDTCIRQLDSYDYNKLTKEQQLTYDVLKEYLETQKAYAGSEVMQNIFAPSSGLIANLSTNFVEFYFYDQDDIDHYLLYLESLPAYMDSVFAFTREQAEEGYFMDDYLVEQVIDQCNLYLEAEEDPYIASFEEKIANMDLASETEEAYIARNEQLVSDCVIPVYQDTVSFLEELKGTGQELGGLCNYGTVGKKYYEAIIRDKTSSDLSAEELITLLDDAMSDLLKDLLAIASVDYDTYEEYFSYQPDYDDPDQVLEDILAVMEKDFPTPPTTNYDIQYQNKACEIEGTVAYYLTARIDDISRNSIKVNGSAVAGDSLTLYTTLAHEGYPGHLYQFTSFYADESVPNIRKVIDFIGATEGWAEYASACTVDYLDASENMKRIIVLNELFGYIICSRADLGVNYEGWTQTELSDYLNVYIEADDETVEDIYYTCIGDPGLLFPYTIGHIMMDQLREEAENALGDAFDAKEYHAWILSLGIAPFSVYEKELQSWLER